MVLVDDSIVRGTTSRKIVQIVREAGAKEIHMRISCPPTTSPCFYGIDTPTKKELIASTHNVEEIRQYLGADSLGYQSLEGLRRAVGDTQGRFCLACYSGRLSHHRSRASDCDSKPGLRDMEPLENQTADGPVSGQPISEPAASGSPEPESEKPEATSRRRESACRKTVRSLLVVLVGVLTRTFIAEATVIPTGSMESTIMIGDHVFLNKLLYGPRLPYTSFRIPPLRSVHRQDIVAFRYPRNPSVMFVKRVIGVGGDVIRIEDRSVFVNGRPLKEPYIQFQYSSTLPLRGQLPTAPQRARDLACCLGAGPVMGARNAQFHSPRRIARAPGILLCMGDNRSTLWTADSGGSFHSKTSWANRSLSTGPTTPPPASGPARS